MTDSPVRVCIVGAGPRGLSVLERICANAGGRAVDVHMVDPHPPGAGKVWRTDQSRHLLMNTIASQITMFTDETVQMDGPVIAGPSLAEWARRLAADESAAGFDDWVRQEARTLGPNSYPTRAFFGHYLRWVFGRVVDSAPAGLRVHTHARHAVDLADSGPERTQEVLLSDGSVLAAMDAVVLAQGHIPTAAGEEAPLRRFARSRGLRYVRPANPADVDLTFVRPGEHVLLRGLGLCFFDYLSLLTAGRGGRFERHGTEVCYLPSGDEPRIYAGSRRGVPYHARGENEKGAFGRYEPRVLTPGLIGGLRARGAAIGGLDFRRDVWPLVAKEVQLVYYSTLLRQRSSPVDPEWFAAAFLALPPKPGADNALLRRCGIGPADRWDWDRVMNPAGGRCFSGPEEFHRWLVGHLRSDVAQARAGNVSSPVKAALDVLRDLRNEIRLLVDHGGLTGRSHRDDLDGWFTPANAFLSIGPPLRRTEEALALISAGVLHIVGPGLRVAYGAARRSFEAMSPLVRGSQIEVSALIEARLGEPDIRRTTDPLLRRMLAAAQARPYHVPDHRHGPHEASGLAVTRRPYRVVDAAGRPHPRRFAFGVPTESVHWVTAAGIRPGVNSVTLADADAIAALVLRLRSGDTGGTSGPRPQLSASGIERQA